MKVLLMGGQACVFYGAAEFSRDLDLLTLVDSENLERLRQALTNLHAQPIAVPSLEAAYLCRGHAVHFRCDRDDVAGRRIDVMSSLRGLPAFEDLWQRRTSIEVTGEVVDLLGLEDLVNAKKTQCDKDWPMIRRLVEQSYFSDSKSQSLERIQFWLRQLRTPEVLFDVAKARPAVAQLVAPVRPVVQATLNGNLLEVERVLEEEEREVRRQDRLYWEPLKRELEHLRRQKREGRQTKRTPPT